MKMKKKALTLCLAVALAATAVVGGTMAYFTDTAEATNTFTAGGVKIDLIEQQGNEDGTDLVDYVDGKTLMPIVGSAQGEKYTNGQPKAENYIDKIATIKNDGKSDAYVRAYFAIPSALDDGYDTFNAGLNVLHFNFGNNNGVSTFGNEWNWKNASGTWKYYETEIDGVKYNVYYADYTKILKAGKTTEQFISGVYLDSHVDMDAQGNYIDTRNQQADISILAGNVKCPVMAVAVQAAGFDNADAAVTAAFGANFDPFKGTNVTNWQK